MSLFY